MCMTTFLLIRHGACDPLGRYIAGRLPGIHLNEQGRRDAGRLVERLEEVPIARVLSSPLERARETAAPLADSHGIDLEFSAALQEIDFGDWSGKSFEQLHEQPQWRWFNEFRSNTRIPGGEMAIEVQARMAAELTRLGHEARDEVVAVVGHADPLKMALVLYLGMPIDCGFRLAIAPASVSVITVQDWGPVINCINTVDGTPPPFA